MQIFFFSIKDEEAGFKRTSLINASENSLVFGVSHFVLLFKIMYHVFFFSAGGGSGDLLNYKLRFMGAYI